MGVSQQFCTFLLDGHVFGTPVPKVQEVIQHQEMTRVPLSPDVVSGLINLRGQIVSAIDLKTPARVARQTSRPTADECGGAHQRWRCQPSRRRDRRRHRGRRRDTRKPSRNVAGFCPGSSERSLQAFRKTPARTRYRQGCGSWGPHQAKNKPRVLKFNHNGPAQSGEP